MFRLPERIIYSDASEYAGAGFTVGDNHIVHFMWDKEDRIKSSTWRELKAVKNILESLQLMLCGKLVKLYTDNQNVVKIVQKGTSGVDAFAYDWSKFNNWVVPPVNLITRAINHMQMCKAKGVLVVPKWKSAIFWPRIVDRFTDTYKKFVKDFREYKNPKNFFVAGSHDNSIFAKQPFNSHVLVLLVDFS
ncbi:Hypothetical predicted protein [Mytilus galloprovincialis]|uniref:RNase H type-1 domain-containing protein n=1 Tax=Mytilus galloprovincialis TaxID=29158 RepID=A0A8B6G3C3_MYTGA|nr:Hypothetical predicted protein [Mytilus galloprovincialis]